MKCHRAFASGHSGIFAFASWIYFRRKNICPQSAAARIVSGGCDLETASSMTESGAPPRRSQAARIRCWDGIQIVRKKAHGQIFNHDGHDGH